MRLFQIPQGTHIGMNGRTDSFRSAIRPARSPWKGLSTPRSTNQCEGSHHTISTEHVGSLPYRQGGLGAPQPPVHCETKGELPCPNKTLLTSSSS